MRARPAAATVALLAALAAGCGREAPRPSWDAALLHWDDLDGVAHRFLSEQCDFGRDLAPGGTRAEHAFHEALARYRATDELRVAGAFDYDLPALVRYVLARPPPAHLDLAWLEGLGDADFSRAAVLARGESSADPVVAAARAGDPLGLRALLLQSRLQRDGVDPTRARPQDVGAAFAAVNRFLDEEQAKIERRSEPPGVHFLDWFLKTTTLTGLAPKIGLLTEELLSQLPAVAPGSVHRALVVGPGVDLASPHLGAVAPVAMYQPFELADTLRRLKLAAEDLAVDALDVNPHVLAVLQRAREEAGRGEPLHLELFRGAGSGRLVVAGVDGYLERLFTSYADSPRYRRGPERALLSPDVALRAGLEIRRNFAAALARPGGPAPDERGQLGRLLERVELEARVAVHAVELPPQAVLTVSPLAGDVVTDRFAEPDRYDLILCTNVLVYFPPQAQWLALLNLRRVARKGALLIATDDFGAKEGETICGWRPEKSASHLDFDPQYAYRCVKAR